MLTMFSQVLGNKSTSQRDAALSQEIERVHYYYRHAKVTPDVRRLMAYRKLTQIKDLTPQLAQVILQQWDQLTAG